jgi:hypothetical protein
MRTARSHNVEQGVLGMILQYQLRFTPSCITLCKALALKQAHKSTRERNVRELFVLHVASTPSIDSI